MRLASLALFNNYIVSQDQVMIGIVISPMVNLGFSFALTTFLVPLLLIAYVGNYLYFRACIFELLQRNEDALQTTKFPRADESSCASLCARSVQLVLSNCYRAVLILLLSLGSHHGL